jgi:outer membrane scaffolding protein for murein synthesis (MipA/OmpV family)
MDNDMVRILLALLAVTVLGSAVAAEDEPRPPEPDEKVKRDIEGAIGPVFTLSPEYEGSSRRRLSVVGGFFLRYGRYTVSNTGAFVTRRKDDVFRGLGVDLKQSEAIRFNFALRIDRGRRSATSESLQGLQNVPATLRGRASITRPFDRGFKGSVGWSPDLLHRGGGQTADVGLSHDRTLSPGLTWNVGAGVSWGNARFMRSYYGVTPEESVASGYPAYTPGAGWKDASLGTTWRLDVDKRWVAFWGGSVTRVLGPAAESPLTRQRNQWSLTGGIAWRF